MTVWNETSQRDSQHAKFGSARVSTYGRRVSARRANRRSWGSDCPVDTAKANDMDFTRRPQMPSALTTEGSRRTATPQAFPRNESVDKSSTDLLSIQEVSTTVFDVVADNAGQTLLMPVGKSSASCILVSQLPEDQLVTIRVFRFFEDSSDAAMPWEKELRNVNSGSLLWLVAHLEPGMHTNRGAKYGKWFTVHYVRMQSRHFKSGYHMCNEGACCPINSFGATLATTGLITGQHLDRGYFWFVSPDRSSSACSAQDVTSEDNLRTYGWQHLGRMGPFNGDTFSTAWKSAGAPMEERRLQQIFLEVSAAAVLN